MGVPCAVCLLTALARSQDIVGLVQEQLNGPAVQSILSNIPEAFQCRSNSGAFIRSCTLVRADSMAIVLLTFLCSWGCYRLILALGCCQDLVQTTSLKDDSATLLNLVNIDQAANSLTIKGNELSGFVDGATASDECCRATCEVAKQGCMCDATAWTEMVRLFSGAGGVNAVFNKVVGKCNVGGRSFQAVMDPSSSTCSTDNIATAKAFTC
ncbi:hypothetical protein BSKO_05750 [Bryopsis sp. KO-2023]|nr:hypothetical protein BSKO_05750 [Bryopsis sp. KO-2023]